MYAIEYRRESVWISGLWARWRIADNFKPSINLLAVSRAATSDISIRSHLTHDDVTSNEFLNLEWQLSLRHQFGMRFEKCSICISLALPHEQTRFAEEECEKLS